LKRFLKSLQISPFERDILLKQENKQLETQENAHFVINKAFSKKGLF